MVTIRPILTLAYSGDINSTRNSTLRNIKNPMTTETTQFAQLWVATKYDFKKSQSLFTECSKNRLLTDMILETDKDFDILFIQKSHGLLFIPF